jgi:hypothetical protein
MMIDDKKKEMDKAEEKSESGIRTEDKVCDCRCGCVPPLKSK